MSLSEFSWEVACPTPWGEGTSVYFDFNDPRVYLSVPARLQVSTARQLCQFLRNFSLIEHFCGLRRTIARISDLYRQRGDSEIEAGLQALLAVQMTVLGTETIKDSLLYQFLQFSKNPTSGDYFTCQISSLHGWALHECADYFLRDLLPQIPQQGEGPFAKSCELAEQAQSVRAHFRPISEFFSDEKSPYFHLSEFPLHETTPQSDEKLAIQSFL